jgi:hypothetical protein
MGSLTDLPSLIRDIRPERTLVLTYGADLPYLEHCLLDHLQQGEDGTVLILSDAREYQASMHDRSIVRHVGSSYRYERIRLR